MDLLNRDERVSVELSPFFMAVVAFCFSMTVGVLWEFFERFMDTALLFDMQKDHVQNTIATVALDPTRSNRVVVVKDIADVILVHSDGSQQAMGLGGYLDLGIYDTMKDLFVNFIGAAAFSVIGFFYVKNRGKGRFARRFIPRVLKEQEMEQLAEADDAEPAQDSPG